MGILDIKAKAQEQPQITVGKKRVLVVDDSGFQRRILSASLSRLGYDVTVAGSGDEALKICATRLPDLVLSDWMMPGMTGLEFCQALRLMTDHQYVYFIILTSKSEKNEIILGLDSGADDFLTKPVNKGELRARLAAGERILEMHKEVQRSNALLSETVEELQGMYDALDRDLIEAKTLQQSLLRDPVQDFDTARLSMILRSSGHVGGDLVGHFPAGQGRLGLFAIDVSGHGISSALMTARLAGYLSATSPEHNVALEQLPDGTFGARAPAAVIEDLNELVLGEMQTEHYFTLLLVFVDLATGHLTVGQAGHPHPAVQRRDGSIEQFGTGGFPVGLLFGVDFEQFELQLNPGDRLFIASDGVTECPNLDGDLLDEIGLESMLDKLRHESGAAFLDAFVQDLETYAQVTQFPDDVSIILFEFDGPKA